MRFRVGASAPPPFQKCVFIGILVGGEDLNLRPHGPKFNQQRGKRISPELQADSPHQFVTVYARKRVNAGKHLHGIISTNSGHQFWRRPVAIFAGKRVGPYEIISLTASAPKRSSIRSRRSVNQNIKRKG